LAKIVMAVGSKVPTAAPVSTALNRMKNEKVKDLECEMLITNLGFQLSVVIAGVPPFRKFSMRWDQCLFVIPDPVDASGNYIEILAQDLAYTLNLSFLSSDGDNWETMTVQCLNPMDRDLLYHTSLFFFVNRKDQQQKFYKWAEDKQAGNYNDLQEEFRRSWMAFDWDASGNLVEPCTMWSGEVDEEIAKPVSQPKQKDKQNDSIMGHLQTDSKTGKTQTGMKDEDRRKKREEEEEAEQTAKMFASAPMQIEKKRTIKDVDKGDSESELSEDELDVQKPT